MKTVSNPFHVSMDFTSRDACDSIIFVVVMETKITVQVTKKEF